MRPTPVTDDELAKGILDLNKYLPDRNSPDPEYWAEVIAEAVLYDTIDEDATWAPRLQFDHETAMRHLRAIASARSLTVKDKKRYMAILIGTWWNEVAI